MGRHRSTIGRELRRNNLPKGGYKPASADRIALSRCRRLSKIECLSPLRKHIDDHLAMGWSPEQIAGRLRLEESQHRVSHESIYRFIYRWPVCLIAPLATLSSYAAASSVQLFWRFHRHMVTCAGVITV